MLVNLTPHEINIYDENGKNLLAKLPSEGVARCSVQSRIVGWDLTIPLFSSTIGEVTGLPEHDPEKIYIVSLLVRQALPNRRDIASPGELVRDENGNPIGCKGLVINF